MPPEIGLDDPRLADVQRSESFLNGGTRPASGVAV